MNLSILLLCLPCINFQGAEQEPLPEGAVARLGDQIITKEEYLDYLWQRFGKRAVREYVTDLLIEQESTRFGIELDQDLIQSKVEERENAARNSPRPVDFEEDLKRQGQSIDMFRATVAREIRRDLLTVELVKVTRVVTDERLRQAFEAKYGEDGVQVKVRHILVMPNFLKAEAIRGGSKPNEVDMDQIRGQAVTLIEGARESILGGQDFGTVASQVSHDRVTKDKGGELAQYNGRLYGPAFKEAVLSLKPGEVSEVIESGAGYHLIQLMDRIETDLESVRAGLIQEILESEPTWQEKSSLVQALQGRAKLQLW